jgi:anaerobic ribonucleoside-triphosphate reductase activating protein
LVKKIKQTYPQKKIWFYSGNTYENMTEEQKEVLSYSDVLVDGPFKIELRDITLPFRGSTNQRIIDIQKTLQKGDIELYDRFS